jgi:hypothetical protein
LVREMMKRLDVATRYGHINCGNLAADRGYGVSST